MVSTLHSGSKGLGSSPGRVNVLCSWARHFTLTVPLSTQDYKWVPANCLGNLMKCWGATCDGLASHSGGVAILLVATSRPYPLVDIFLILITCLLDSVLKL